MAVTSKVVRMNPATAELLLRDNDSNRRLRREKVDRWKRLMVSGKWKLNGDAIRISKTGKLLDGQHRLTALLEANVTIDVILIEGLDDDVFATIDDGAKRTAADVLGICGEVNGRRVAASLGMVEKIRDSRWGGHMGGVENSRVEELLAQYPGIRDSITLVGDAGSLVPPSLLSGLHFWFSQVDRQEANEFVHQVISGADLQEGEPVFLLRARLIQNKSSKARLKRDEVAAIIIKAWNARRSGVQRLRYLRWRTEGPAGEEFPRIDGLGAAH